MILDEEVNSSRGKSKQLSLAPFHQIDLSENGLCAPWKELCLLSSLPTDNLKSDNLPLPPTFSLCSLVPPFLVCPYPFLSPSHLFPSLPSTSLPSPAFFPPSCLTFRPSFSLFPYFLSTFLFLLLSFLDSSLTVKNTQIIPMWSSNRVVVAAERILNTEEKVWVCVPRVHFSPKSG